GDRVALKTLQKMTAAELLRFKNELRIVEHVCHPNLVSIHELVAENGEWFVVMDYVDGVGFLEYVRPHRDAPAIGGTIERIERSRPTVTGSGDPRPDPPGEEVVGHTIRRGVLDEGRLRSALCQLADSVLAMHSA